jgi:trans-2,3-dihydro-3-hydroxyanthranilate isomerase
MKRRYVTVDVFTAQRYAGNPLAVVLDAEGLDTAQMQRIAVEFNYAETSFVLPPRSPGHTAQVRIFTPGAEMPFAGHPNVGTAVVLAREGGYATIGGDRFVFDELAGEVPLTLLREAGVVVAAELRAPRPLSVGAAASPADAAACLGLKAGDVRIDAHPPVAASVGLPFLVAEVASLAALSRARYDVPSLERVLAATRTEGIFAYCIDAASGEWQARMFAPLLGVPEDPATGSAVCAGIALRASLPGAREGEQHWLVRQGVEMGRPSELRGRTVRAGGKVGETYVAGHAVEVMRGSLES